MVFCNVTRNLRKNQLGGSHNPYFNRWFSAMNEPENTKQCSDSHNPYFNRWFSAMCIFNPERIKLEEVTILILIYGFLQYIDV